MKAIIEAVARKIAAEVANFPWDALPEESDNGWSRETCVSLAIDFLTATGIPLETLAALRAGAWKAVPVEPTSHMIGALYASIGADGKRAGGLHWQRALAAAPERPEDL